MSPAAARIESDEPQSVAEANAMLDALEAFLRDHLRQGEALAAAKDALPQWAERRGGLLRPFVPQPKPAEPVAAAPDLIAGLPADLTDPLVLAQVAAVCARMRAHKLAKGEHDGIAALGRFATALGQHVASLKAASEGQAA